MSDNKIVSPTRKYELDLTDSGQLILYRQDGSVYKVLVGADPHPRPEPEPPPAATLPRLRVNGHVFETETGQPFTAVQCSDFNLLNRWQRGENIIPVLEQRRDAGFNMLRVWTLYDLVAANIGQFLDIDYARIPDFLALCARYGVYVEFTAYTSTERVTHWDRLCEACRVFEDQMDAIQYQTPAGGYATPSARVATGTSGRVLLELVNEGTLPVNQISMGWYARPTGILASHGSGGAEGVLPWEPWDYITFHTNGSSEEQRKVGHNAMEKPQAILNWYGPVLTNETSRYPEVGMWVGASLERQKNLAYDSAAGASLLCAGACFHSCSGKSSVLWTAAELAVARAWAEGARSVSLACQHGAYRRRDDLLTDDLLRVYQRGVGGCIVSIRK